MAYLIDSNVFIHAKNMHYGFDFCPAFWDWLLKANRNGTVKSIIEVANELQQKPDDLAEWTSGPGKNIFQHSRKNLEQAIRELTIWTSKGNYEPAAYRNFLNSTDYWLIVFSITYKYTLVTHEVSSDSLFKIKIPDVCEYFAINCITPFKMLSVEQVKFVLESK